MKDLQLTTFVCIVLALVCPIAFSFYPGLRTVRLVGKRTIHLVNLAGHTPPCSSSSPFVLNQVCIQDAESGLLDKLRHIACSNPRKVTHHRRDMRLYAVQHSYDDSWYEERVTNRSSSLATVANVCAEPVQCKTVQYNQPENWFDNLSVDHVTKLVVEGVKHKEGAANGAVELLVLPTQIRHNQTALRLAWPTFREEKQGNALGRHILITKGKPMITVPAGNPRISENVIDVLLRGYHMAFEGQEGTGKSTELNIILLQLFQSLVDPAQPLKDVFQRADKVLYHYRSVDGKIVCTEVTGAGEDLDDLASYFKAFKDSETIITGLVPRNDVVLLLEMAEKESDPSVAHIPTVVAVTDYRELLKTMHKDGALDIAARPPHTEGELMVLATSLFYSTDRAMLCKNLGLPVDSSLLDVRGQVEKRIQKVGPFIRKVLGSRSVYSY